MTDHTHLIARRSRIAGTRCYEYTAWEPADEFSAGPASTITYIGGRKYGRVGTDPNPALFDHLPAGSDARIQAARDAHERRYRLAYQVIGAAFPETRRAGDQHKCMGAIDLELPEDPGNLDVKIHRAPTGETIRLHSAGSLLGASRFSSTSSETITDRIVREQSER